MRIALLLLVLAAGCTRKVEVEIKGMQKIDMKKFMEQKQKQLDEKEAEIKRLDAE